MEIEKIEKLYGLLSKWLTWQKAGVILIGIGLVFGVASYVLPFFQSNNMDKNMDPKASRTEIDRYIKRLKKEVNPDNIPNVIDDFYDVQVIKEFQKTVLDYISAWESLDNESMADFASQIDDYSFAYYHWLTRKAVLYSHQREIDSLMVLLLNFGNENGIDYNVNNIDVAVISNLAKEHEKMITDANDIVTKRNEEINKKYNVKKIDEEDDEVMMHQVFKEYYKNLKYLDSIKMIPSYYEYDENYFRMLLNMNTKYLLRIKEYKH